MHTRFHANFNTQGMTKQTLLLFGFLYFTVLAHTQSYDFAIGARLGTDIGISTKLRLPPIDENFTLETILQSSLERDEAMLTVLGAQHFPMITRRINFYGGGGVHFGWFDNKEDEAPPSYKAPAGISLIGGAEINFKNINISADFKPVINIQGGEKTIYSQTAVSIRFIPFKRYDIFESPKQKRKKKRQAQRDKRRQERQKSGKKSWEFWKKG